MSGPRRIRVLHLIETLGRGGAEGLLYTNLSRLDRDRFEGVVVQLYDRDVAWREPIRALGYPVRSLGMRSLRDAGRGLVRLTRMLARDSIDLVHTHLYGSNLLGRVAGRLAGVPVVSSLHCPEYEPAVVRESATLSPAKLTAMRLLDRLSCRLADPRFVAVSEHVKHSAMHHLGLRTDRLRVIHNPVDLAHFDPTRHDGGDVRATLDIPAGAPVLVSVARYDPPKGLRYLFEAMRSLVAEFPDVTLVVLGGGSPAARDAHGAVAEQFGVRKHCRLLGVQPDVRPYLALADVFVLPTLVEGFGIAVIEAMAMERPCVVTRVDALPEVVDDGRTGILVAPADPGALASAIARLLRDPDERARLGAAGRRVVRARYDVEDRVKDLEALYLEAAARR